MRLCLVFGAGVDYWCYRLQGRTRGPGEMGKLWWGRPGPSQGSQCQVPPGCHILLWGKADMALLPLRGWQKRWHELTLLSTSPCHIWLWVSSEEGEEFYFSWHHRDGLKRCPLKNEYSFCALQQHKCFEAIPCCMVCAPIQVEGKEHRYFKVTHSPLCWEK